MKVLSLCTSAGLWDRAWIDAGYEIVPGCEIMKHKREMYQVWCGGEPLCYDIADLPNLVQGRSFYGVIGGIPCQAHSRLRAMRSPKFGDLLEHVLRVLGSCSWKWYLFENVRPLAIPNAKVARMNAMNYGKPHQSRLRHFTHSPNLTAPESFYPGDADDLFAYSVVAGRIYGPKRAARLQGWPEFADLPFPCRDKQEALADGVPKCLADAWIEAIEGRPEEF